jgi:hypothetical protein
MRIFSPHAVRRVASRLTTGSVGPRRRVCVAGTVIVWAALSAGTASASTWSLENPVSPSSVLNNFSGVSCARATACMAVGSDINASTGINTLAERWNGNSWQLQSTAPEGTGNGAGFGGVSCPRARACTAVGNYPNGAGTEVALAERWNGTRWRFQATPNPSGATSSGLASVSCPRARACTAVGSYVNSAGAEMTLAEHWNGTRWRIQPMPNPSGATSSSLASVSCARRRACIAVGGYSANSSGVLTDLAERWNGRKWVVLTMPASAGGASSVSCSAPNACTAVDATTSAERWNGVSWQPQPTPAPAFPAGDGLSAVSCPKARACIAVGGQTQTNGLSSAELAEYWNGATWQVQLDPTPVGGHRTLFGVSCVTARTCTAVGTNGIQHSVMSSSQTLAWGYS